MNAVLSRLSDNPVIGKIVEWPPSQQKIKLIRGSLPVFRKPFIEIEFEDGRIKSFSFPKAGFAKFWAEAGVVLETVTDIAVVSEFDFRPLENKSKLVKQILEDKEECIEDSSEMYNAGMYKSFLDQYGENCRDLPDEVLGKIALARKRVSA